MELRTLSTEAEERARLSGGASNSSTLYELTRDVLLARTVPGGTLVDVGCGRGALYRYVAGHIREYLGVDLVEYPGFTGGEGVRFIKADIDGGCTTLADECADAVCSLETIEHLENPRAFARELVRLAKPGGIIVITTPNQLSVLSKLSLVLKNQFVHFQERPGLYPAHLTALLEEDLVRISRENQLLEVEVHFTGEGRIPLTARHWPTWLTARQGWRGRAFSDNVLVVGRKP
jgi:2-polyprenyl-3-methyl-5-hydroxy-6-metoxy-1,4-benzoquinol methylase